MNKKKEFFYKETNRVGRTTKTHFTIIYIQVATC